MMTDYCKGIDGAWDIEDDKMKAFYHRYKDDYFFDSSTKERFEKKYREAIETPEEKEALDQIEKEQYNEVSNPKHYKVCGDLEAKDIIRAVTTSSDNHLALGVWQLICWSHALKYILRLGKKDQPIQDTAKAIQWLQFMWQEDDTKS